VRLKVTERTTASAAWPRLAGFGAKSAAAQLPRMRLGPLPAGRSPQPPRPGARETRGSRGASRARCPLAAGAGSGGGARPGARGAFFPQKAGGKPSAPRVPPVGPGEPPPLSACAPRGSSGGVRGAGPPGRPVGWSGPADPGELPYRPLSAPSAVGLPQPGGRELTSAGRCRRSCLGCPLGAKTV